MSIRWATRQVLALLLLALVMVVVSSGLELLEVFRSALGQAKTEAQLVSSAVRRQLVFQAADRADASLAEMAQGPRVAMVMNDARARGSSVLHVAVLDSSGVTVAHTRAEAIGAFEEERPTLPEVEGTLETLSTLWEFWREPRDMQVQTLLKDHQGRPAGSIRVIIGSAFLEHDLSQAFRRGLLTALIVALVALIAGTVLTRLASRRVRFLEAGVAALREGRFEEELPESGIDEFDRLARELNLLGREFQKTRDPEDVPPHPAADLLGNGIIVVDPDHRVFFSNTVARQRLDGVPMPMGERVEDSLSEDHPLCGLLEALDGAGDRSLAVRLPSVEGEEPHVAVAHRIHDESAAAGTLIEIKRERSLAEIHFLVDQSRILRRIGEMAAGVAHELRGPLQSIHFDLDALGPAVGDDPERARELVADIHAKVQRLEWAVKGFLKVSRLRPLTLDTVDVEQLLGEVVDQLQADALMAGVALELDLAPDVPNTLGDQEVLSQAVKNLVANAIQALPSRTGTVIVRAREENEGVRIEVSDSGPGIAAEHLERIFDLYFTTRQEGTGVGLALVRQTAELHRGSCHVDSSPGEGTTVVLVLPRLESSPLIA